MQEAPSHLSGAFPLSGAFFKVATDKWLLYPSAVAATRRLQLSLTLIHTIAVLATWWSCPATRQLRVPDHLRTVAPRKV